jgi:hypothetical protein
MLTSLTFTLTSERPARLPPYLGRASRHPPQPDRRGGPRSRADDLRGAVRDLSARGRRRPIGRSSGSPRGMMLPVPLPDLVYGSLVGT